MRTARVAGALVLAMLLAGCGGAGGSGGTAADGAQGGDATSGAPARDGAGGEGSAPSAIGVQVGSVVPRGTPGELVTGVVTPTEGGTVSVDLGDAQTATLTVPPGAVREEQIIGLQAFTAGSVRGLRMLPDGLVLLTPALLTLSSPSAVLLRIGAQVQGDLFAAAAVTRDGSVPVIRLRPMVLADPSVTPTEFTDQWPGPQPPGPDGVPGATDDIDASAAQQEERAAQDPPAEPEDPEAIQDLAAQWVPPLTSRCMDAQDAARARLAAARASAGAKAPAVLPECLTRAVVVTASLEFQWVGEGTKVAESTERVGGEGDVTNEVEENLLPLQGELVGENRLLTLMFEGMRQSADYNYEYGLKPEIAKQLMDSLPKDATCRVNSPLSDGQMSVRLDVPDNGVDGDITVTVQPLGGVFHVTCGKVSQDTPIQVWSFVRLLKGMSENQPFVFTFPRNKQSTNVLNQLTMSDEAAMKRNPNGSVTVSTDGFILTVSMHVSVYESMKALQKEREDAEKAGATSSR